MGIWRTLGAGGVKQRKIKISENLSPSNLINNGHVNDQLREELILYKLNTRLTLTEKLFYYYEILVKIGYFYYWLLSSLVSIAIYIILKFFMIGSICNMLGFSHLAQNMVSAVALFLFVFILSITLCIDHIYDIYISPLVSTIKPIKRTFDEVKVRIIHLSTFGISS